jgi:Skp family chaperone for outer membrane proteins
MRHLLLALLCSCAIGLSAETATPTGPIAVVSLDTVLNTAKLFTASRDRVGKAAAEAERQSDAMDKEEKKIKAQLDLINKAKPEAAQLQEQLDLLRYQHKLFVDRTRGTLERSQAEAVSAAYDQMRALLKTFAQEKGIKLVLQLPPGKVSTSSMQQLLLQLGSESVLYSDASFDVTEPFIAYLNAAYAASGDAPAPTPAAPATDPAPGK